MKKTWTKADRKAICLMFEDVLQSFEGRVRDHASFQLRLETPADRKCRSSEVRFQCPLGPIDVSMTISDDFLHVYFCFDDVELAKSRPLPKRWPGILNSWCGKWNAILLPLQPGCKASEVSADEMRQGPFLLADDLRMTLEELGVLPRLAPERSLIHAGRNTQLS